LFFLDLLFPKYCVSCRAEGEWLCAKCQNSWQFFGLPDCLVCGAPTGGRICAEHGWALQGLVAAASYDDLIIKSLLKIYKYNFAREAGQELLKILSCAWEHYAELATWPELYPAGRFQLMSVPLSRRRQRWRGFNQAAELAQGLAGRFNFDYRPQGLVRLKNNKPQAFLSGAERQTNLENCFAWRGESLAGQSILLIDDVATTGTTLNECAKVLKSAGAVRVWALVIARGG
jgi:ComF family protein